MTVVNPNKEILLIHTRKPLPPSTGKRANQHGSVMNRLSNQRGVSISLDRCFDFVLLKDSLWESMEKWVSVDAGLLHND